MQRARDSSRERDYIVSPAEAGVTWWTMYVSPDTEEAMLRCIEEGPARI